MAARNLPEMPCGPILELHGQRKRFHVPYGLKKLLEDMTREVLRSQPENIYEFLAEMMEARGQRRQTEIEKKNQRKSWQVHRWSWEGSSLLDPEDLKDFLSTLSAPEEVTTHHAVVIQSAFRGYQARKKVKEIRKSLGRESVGSGAAKKSNVDEERPIETLTPATATQEEVKSATIIQSAFRGMQTRKQLREEEEDETFEQEQNEDIDAYFKDLEDPDEEPQNDSSKPAQDGGGDSDEDKTNMPPTAPTEDSTSDPSPDQPAAPAPTAADDSLATEDADKTEETEQKRKDRETTEEE